MYEHCSLLDKRIECTKFLTLVSIESVILLNLFRNRIGYNYFLANNILFFRCIFQLLALDFIFEQIHCLLWRKRRYFICCCCCKLWHRTDRINESISIVYRNGACSTMCVRVIDRSASLRPALTKWLRDRNTLKQWRFFFCKRIWFRFSDEIDISILIIFFSSHASERNFLFIVFIFL